MRAPRIFAILTAALLTVSLFVTPSSADSSDSEREAALLARGLEALAACTDDTMTDTEKLTALHDWMSLHCDYGATRRGETAYGALVEGTANCVGYAKGYAYLASLAGLDGAFTYSEELDHAWILVSLGGVRYFSDCTWDDGKHMKLGLIRHRYWLFDERNAADLGHTGCDSTETVSGGREELAPWRAAVTRVIFEGGCAYYIDESFRLMRCDRETWETEVLLQAEGSWPEAESGKQELCTSLLYFGGRLFFNTPDRVLCADITGENLCAVYELPTGENRLIYGIGVRDGIFCYSLAATPDDVVYDICPLAPVQNVWGE